MSALVHHLRNGGDVDGFVEAHQVTRDQILETILLGLDRLVEQESVPVGPPQASLLPRTDRAGVIVNADELAADLVIGRKVLCPACHTLVFQSWPEGWDSHAEHKCPGIHAVDPERRKAEFKRRFESLFR